MQKRNVVRKAQSYVEVCKLEKTPFKSPEGEMSALVFTFIFVSCLRISKSNNPPQTGEFPLLYLPLETSTLL